METSAELLDAVLSSKELQPEQLDALLRRKVKEDLHLDYKRGGWLNREQKTDKERNRALRKWVAGFANAEGGVLLVGVAGGDGEQDDPKWQVTGCEAFSNSAKLKEWADDALRDLAPYLRPSPRTHVVEHSSGLVLVVAVDRAPNLVPCKEDSGLVYYLRNGHQTVKIDPYLHADLVLGRRQRPSLRIEGKGEVSWKAIEDPITITWNIIIDNYGLVWANDLRIIAIGQFNDSGTVPSSLKHQLALEENEHKALRRRKVRKIDILEPMDEVSFPFSVSLTPPQPSKDGSCSWRGALCILTSNGLPEWAQLEIQFDFAPPDTLAPSHLYEFKNAWIKEERVIHLSSRDRAIISCKWS